MKKAFLQLHIAVFLAGFTGILGRLITLNEGMIVWYRLLLTAATMWILFGFMKKLQKIPLIDIIKISAEVAAGVWDKVDVTYDETDWDSIVFEFGP